MEKTADTVYLDYAASTPVRDAVLEAMRPYWQDQFANPQSSHDSGARARKAVEKARERIAQVMQVQASEIIFTSGATEANSLTLFGRLKAAEDKVNNPKAAVSVIEHPSLFDCEESEQYPCNLIPVDSSGVVKKEALKEKLDERTAVVSVGYVNNEIGTIQSLAEIAGTIRKSAAENAVLHTDASQAGLFQPLQPDGLGVDMMTINGHKLYGPKGIGLLWVRSGTPMHSLFVNRKTRVVGDYQTLRSGTPPTPLIAGLAEAIKWAHQKRDRHKREVQKLRDYLIDQLEDTFPDARINGSRTDRIANNISVSFPDTNHDYLAAQLDNKGICVSAASACQSKGGESAVLSAMPQSPNTAVRVSLGLETSQADIETFLIKLRECR